MTPYTFANAGEDWGRFTRDADAWKPEGFDGEMKLRLAYYLEQQLDDTKAELRRRFTETWQAMTPVTLPIVSHFVNEKAKVFLATSKLELATGEGEPVGDEIAKWWEKTKERMGLSLRLKRTDAYTTLLRTAGLKIGRIPGRFTAHVVFPQDLRVVMDPEAPMDLDRAYGVALEIASEAGITGSGARRFEFWCAREGEEVHGIVEERQVDGETRVSFTPDEGDAIVSGGRAIVPLVLFTAHTEELGLFTSAGADLVSVNRSLNVLCTDIQHIAEQQGFGVMVLEAPAGANAPAKIIRAPNTAISLSDGVKASFIDPNAPIADLVALANTRIKQDAVLRGLSAGSVSIEARAVASGVALQIENRGVYEARADAVEVYRDPMRRLWDVIRAVNNAYSREEGVPPLDEDIELRWTPGEIQVPTDDAEALDAILGELNAGLCTRAEAIAKRRGISLKEAEEVLAKIDAEKAARKVAEPPVDDPLGLAERRRKMAAGEMDPEDMDEPEEPEEPPVKE